MKEKLKSSFFKYGFNPKNSQDLLDNLSKKDPKLFEELVNKGVQIVSLSKNEDIEGLKGFVEANKQYLSYFSCFVKDAFLSALNFKYFEVIEYFLQNGLDMKSEHFQDCLVDFCRISKYLNYDLPIELFQILLEYGADPNAFDSEKYQTTLHCACKNGQFDFVKILIESGKTEINPVDKKGKTPLKYLEDKMKKGRDYGHIFDYVKEHGGELTWKQG